MQAKDESSAQVDSNSSQKEESVDQRKAHRRGQDDFSIALSRAALRRAPDDLFRVCRGLECHHSDSLRADKHSSRSPRSRSAEGISEKRSRHDRDMRAGGGEDLVTLAAILGDVNTRSFRALIWRLFDRVPPGSDHGDTSLDTEVIP